MAIDFVTLNDGSKLPQLGQGTAGVALDDARYEEELLAFPRGIDLGMTLIDNAELYCEGKQEMVVGESLKGIPRDRYQLVSKIIPDNANKAHFMSSLKKSLFLLRADYLDLYLLHWQRGSDINEVVYLMEDARDKGLIKNWGVSNFDVDEMEELWKIDGGKNCAVNQVLYNLASRGIEYDLMPWQREHGVKFMAYSPVGRAGAAVTLDGVTKEALMQSDAVKALAKKYDATEVQILLAFVLSRKDVIAIPKSIGEQHMIDNVKAADICLTEDDLASLDEDFPAPTEKVKMEKY